MNSTAKLFTVICLFVLTACAQVEKAEYQTPLSVPRDAHVPPLYFSGLKVDLPKGQDVGVITHQSRFCGVPYEPIDSSILRGQTKKDELQQVFEHALEPLGYDVVTSPSEFFFEEEAQNEILRAEFKVGVKLVDIDLVACGQEQSYSFLGFQRKGVKGELTATYEWSVFDNIRKSTVYKTRSTGYAKRQDIHPDGLSLMLYDSFEMAAHNLGSESDFFNLMVRGIIPAQDQKPDIVDSFRQDEKISIPRQKQSPVLNLERVKDNVVLVEAGAGHGSGFFISADGYLLTNAHVIGKAQRVRIVTSEKEHKLSAHVLRTNQQEDLALLKIEKFPENLNIVPLSINEVWPDIGSEVFVIGAPLSTKLQDTVTKGIISAHRKDFPIFGKKIDLLQADVAVQAGNSGGPMVDNRGNIVGISVASVGLTNESLNYFIPIDRAFASLNITY